MSILGVCEDGWIMCPTEVLTGSALPSSALRFFFDDLSEVGRDGVGYG